MIKIDRTIYLVKYYGVKYTLCACLARIFRGTIVDHLFLHGKLDVIKHSLAKHMLKKKYHNIILKYVRNASITNLSEGHIKRVIWIFWWQTLENAPPVVRACIKSIKRWNNGYDIIILNKDNYKDYVDMPVWIETKYAEGKISITHFSDILRVTLLSQYGGIWMDATLYQTGPLNEEISNCDFFTAKGAYKDDRLWTLFFLSSEKDNTLMRFARDFLYEYWKTEECAIEYLIFDEIIRIGYEEIPAIKTMIDEIQPVIPEAMFKLYYLYWNQIYNKDIFNELCRQTPLHKVSYKGKKAQPGTFGWQIENEIE